MKIGILTFHYAYNYGAVLQAFATQKLLEFMGHTPEFIDYRNGTIVNSYENLHFSWRNSYFKAPYLAIWALIKSKFQEKKERKFDLFKTNKINISNHTYTKADDVDVKDYDLVLIGSDQVWNPLLTGGLDKAYFGDLKRNPSTRIVSWSPSSLYLDFTEEELKQMANFIPNFSHISVRDENLQNIISKISNRNVEITLDPVLMIKPEIWKSMCHEVKENDYVLVYAVKHRDETWALATKIAKKFHKKIIEIKSNIKADFHSSVRNTCSPEDFLSYIYHADFVVASSFHGTVFSIIFEKQFINYVPGSIKDSRVLTILKSLGLDSRAVNENYDFNNISCEINYADAQIRLEFLQKKSNDFLISAIHNK